MKAILKQISVRVQKRLRQEMKRFISIVSVQLIFASNLFGQSLSNCEKFHEGKFNSVVAGEWVTTIERIGDKQIELFEGNRLEFRVEWLDNCIYRLIPIDVGSAPKVIRTFSIVEVREHSYDVQTPIDVDGTEVIVKITLSEVKQP